MMMSSFTLNSQHHSDVPGLNLPQYDIIGKECMMTSLLLWLMMMSSCALDSQYQWNGTWFESVLSLDMVHWRYERQLTPPAAKRGESV